MNRENRFRSSAEVLRNDEARMSNDEGMTNKLNVIRYFDTLLHRGSDSTIQRFLGRRSLGEGGNGSTI